MLKIHTTAEWTERARAVLPAGSFGNFAADVVIAEGAGSRVRDVDGREYVDYLIGSGPMILGHGHPEVMEAILAQLPHGATFFANNTRGIELAEAIVDALACAERVRFVSTGSEADMYAIRLARAFTGRPKIVKFEGAYHGMCAEGQMSLAPERLANFPEPVPDSAGIPQAVAADVLVAPYNDAVFAESLLAEHGHEVAAILVEPLQRIIPPAPGFLETLRRLADEKGIVLVFDEVVTGFRLAYGGGQAVYGVVPDVATVGKIVGGGFPLAAIAGRADIMAHFDKGAVGAERWLMQVGTLSGNPVAAVAGLKTLEILRRPGAYERLAEIGGRVMASIGERLFAAGVPHRVVGVPSLFDVVFTDRPVTSYRDVKAGDQARSAAFNTALRDGGVLKSPGKFYPSLALARDDLAITDAAIERAAAVLAAA